MLCKCVGLWVVVKLYIGAISQLHASESIHGMYDVTSGCSIAATLSIAVNGEIGRWAFEMCA